MPLRGATHPAKLVVGGLVKLVDEADLDAACIFVVAPLTFSLLLRPRLKSVHPGSTT